MMRPGVVAVSCGLCGTVFDADDPDQAGACRHDWICRACFEGPTGCHRDCWEELE